MVFKGKSISFRSVQLEDAEFILSLRLDDRLNRYLSPVDSNLQQQVDWLREYKKRELNGTEYYFIIEDNRGEELGTLRLYDFRDNSFSWGSWIIKQGAPSNVAIESALLVYEFAFKILNFTQTHFEVIKENSKVKAFHERLGAELINSDEQKNYYVFSRQSYENISGKYRKYLP